MDMNAREAMHVIELRTAPQGHPAYRRVCQQMHTLIAGQAGHRAIAAAMKFADHSVVELERLQEERRLEEKRKKTSGVVVRNHRRLTMSSIGGHMLHTSRSASILLAGFGLAILVAVPQGASNPPRSTQAPAPSGRPLAIEDYYRVQGVAGVPDLSRCAMGHVLGDDAHRGGQRHAV